MPAEEKPIIHPPTDISAYKDAAQTAEQLTKSATVNKGGTDPANQSTVGQTQGTGQTNNGETETGTDTVTPPVTQSTTTTTEQQPTTTQLQGARKVIPPIDMTATDHAIMNHYIQIIALLQNKVSMIDPRLAT